MANYGAITFADAGAREAPRQRRTLRVALALVLLAVGVVLLATVVVSRVKNVPTVLALTPQSGGTISSPLFAVAYAC